MSDMRVMHQHWCPMHLSKNVIGKEELSLVKLFLSTF